MATKKTTTASKSAKKVAPAKATPAKKTVAAKKSAAPAKKVAAPKKATPAKKAAAKSASPAKKVTAPKKAVAPAKKMSTPKAAAKVAAPAKAAKKVADTKKVVDTKKAAVVKKEVKTVAKVAEVAKKPAKSAEKPVKKVMPVKPTKAEKVTPAKAAKAEKPVSKPEKKPSSRRKAEMEKPAPMLSARAEIVDAVGKLPKKHIGKPGVIIAHRKVEKKDKKEEPGLTMKEYNPTVRSVLDTLDQNTGPVYRYSDEELTEFKELIMKRLENARRELAYLQGLITRKDEAGTDDTDNRFNHMEDGSGAMEREQLSQLAGRQIQFINHLEKALVRIENKTYGICRVTGKLIDKARLRAVPHATLSIEAKNVMNK